MRYAALNKLKNQAIRRILLKGAVYDPSTNFFIGVDEVIFCLKKGGYISIVFERGEFDCDENQEFNGQKWILLVNEITEIETSTEYVHLQCKDTFQVDEIFLAIQDVNSLDERFYETCDHLYFVFNQFEMLIYYDRDKDEAWVGHEIAPIPDEFNDKIAGLFLKNIWKR